MTLNPTSNDIYFALVGTAFEPEGPLDQALARAGRSYRRSGAQVDYANRVAHSFTQGRNERGAAIALLEGETGLGKTLGYLVPMAIFCALRGKRGVVAVSPQSATDPHIVAELAIAIEVAQELTGRDVTWARRFAASDFLSRDRIMVLKAGLPPLREDLAISAAGLERCCDEAGRLPDWLRDFGALPMQIRAGDICGDRDGAAYRAHLIAAAGAGILLVPHALLLDSLAGAGDLAGEASTAPSSMKATCCRRRSPT
ncbi:MAG: hypothetical protein WDN06_07100 [Asticcacaulis sp.]